MDSRIASQRVERSSTRSLPIFYRNLEESLDERRASHIFNHVVQNGWQTSSAVDFCSGNILSIGSSNDRRVAFLAELDQNANLGTGSSGVRLMDGNYSYLEHTEREIAEHHGAEAGLLLASAWEANVAVWSAVPRPGDVIIHDTLVHASSYEGFKQSMAMEVVEFAHNDVDDFRRALHQVWETQPLVRQGKRSILVALEGVYSMDGDVCPLQDLVDVARDMPGIDGDIPNGNIQFVVDEAHSVGVLGPQGSGLVCELGLEKDVAIVVHSYGKALGAIGSVVLGSKTIKGILTNFGKSFVYTTSPSFPLVAAIRSGYALLKKGSAEQGQNRIQLLSKLFYELLTSHPLWDLARDKGILSVPLADGWEHRPFLTHIVAISSPQYSVWWMYFHLAAASFCVFPVEYPTVPIGKSRLRLIIHAHNTEDHVRGFISSLFGWVQEMLSIEQGETQADVPKAAGDVYRWMRQEGLTGFGMP
ncbi:5-aminolevulinate synthase [Stachybotrys elegans]|uniref:5-aminolevulinate synthase n=1 Tax=Stachybotrys elegans TaxID=80388 RepID=A0A8K0WXX0_9HYPO|nr:5-aminolevulinate synthase [Stachybotrys elegans]